MPDSVCARVRLDKASCERASGEKSCADFTQDTCLHTAFSIHISLKGVLDLSKPFRCAALRSGPLDNNTRRLLVQKMSFNSSLPLKCEEEQRTKCPSHRHLSLSG